MNLKPRGLLAAMSCLGMFLALSVASFAGEIRTGARMQVKPNSIWFEDTDKFTHWQQLKKSGDAAALASYQEEALSHRDAWQFLLPQPVKILRYDRRKNQVNVEMTASGRLQGTKWLLDADALVQ